MSSGFDLVVQGGTVIHARGRRQADVGITGESIASVAAPMTLSGRQTLDARGLLVLPGGVDPHVHLSFADLPMSDGELTRDDFESGSRAALAGGVTCVGNMSFGHPHESLMDAVERDRRFVTDLSHTDAFVHPVLFFPGEDSLCHVEEAFGRGHTSLKLFMSDPGFDAHFATVVRAMKRVGQLGGTALIHCEDASCVACCGQLLGAVGGGLAHYAASRPHAAELAAVQRAIGLCEITGCPTYVVHVSSAAALDACRQARARGLPVRVETRPLYLHLTQQEYDGEAPGLFTCQPPLRTADDREALWEGLRDGTVDTLGSDHVGWSRADKLAPEHSLGSPRPGVAELETMLPMLLSEGVGRRGLSLERFVDLTSESAARLFGLYPRKGAVREGSDADLVVWDLRVERTIDGASMQSRAGYSVYDGSRVDGWPRWVVQRGALVASEGVLSTAPGRGRLLERTGCRDD